MSGARLPEAAPKRSAWLGGDALQHSNVRNCEESGEVVSTVRTPKRIQIGARADPLHPQHVEAKRRGIFLING